MFKRIVLATDFSEPAETARKLTEKLVSDCNLNPDLAVLTVFDPKDELPKEGVFLPSQLAEEHELKKFYAELGEALVDYCRQIKNRGIAAEQIIREGEPARTIREFATSWQADLIIIGATGRSSGTDRSIGSTADYLLRHSTIPVLVAAHASA